MTKTATSGVLSVVVVMAVTGVYLTRHSRSSGPLAEPANEMQQKDVYVLNSTYLPDKILFEINDTDFLKREKIKEVILYI